MIEVDARGMRCPWPVLRLTRAMRGARSVRLLADDPAAAGEVAAICAERGWSLTSVRTAVYEVQSGRIVNGPFTPDA